MFPKEIKFRWLVAGAWFSGLGDDEPDWSLISSMHLLNASVLVQNSYRKSMLNTIDDDDYDDVLPSKRVRSHHLSQRWVWFHRDGCLISGDELSSGDDFLAPFLVSMSSGLFRRGCESIHVPFLPVHTPHREYMIAGNLEYTRWLKHRSLGNCLPHRSHLNSLHMTLTPSDAYRIPSETHWRFNSSLSFRIIIPIHEPSPLALAHGWKDKKTFLFRLNTSSLECFECWMWDQGRRLQLPVTHTPCRPGSRSGSGEATFSGRITGCGKWGRGV